MSDLQRERYRLTRAPFGPRAVEDDAAPGHRMERRVDGTRPLCDVHLPWLAEQRKADEDEPRRDAHSSVLARIPPVCGEADLRWRLDPPALPRKEWETA